MPAPDREATVVLNDERAERIAALGYDYEAVAKEPVAVCNLCAGGVFAVVAHRDRYGHAAESLGCVRCGLVFVCPRPTEQEYARFYETIYRPLVSAFHGRTIDAQTIELEQERYAQQLAHLLEPFLAAQPGGRLLDAGGSTGVVASALAERFGLTGVVVDPAPAELERAAARGLETVAATMEQFAPEDGSFDVAIMCQTIDHLLDVASTLATLRRCLRDGGLLFVDIVDFRSAYLRARSIEAATKIDHPYALTEDTAEAFLAQAGFGVVRKNYAADGLHVGYVCRPSEPHPALPEQSSVRELFRELRRVQVAATT